MASVKGKSFSLTCSNHRVSVSTNMIFSVLVMSSKVSRHFLLDRIRIKLLFLKNCNSTDFRKKDSVLSINGHGHFSFSSFSAMAFI